MKSVVLTLLLFLLAETQVSAQIDIDSLNQVIENTSASEEKIELHFQAYYYYVSQQDDVNGFAELDKADALANSLKLPEQLAKSYYKRGRLHHYTSDFVQSNVWYRKSIQVPDGTSVHTKVSTYNNIAVNFIMSREYDQALSIYGRVIPMLEEAKAESGKTYVSIYNNIGYCYSEVGIYDSSKYYHMKCLRIRLDAQDEKGLGQTYNNLGTLQYESGDYDSAYYYYKKGNQIASTLPDYSETGVIESEIYMGKVLVALGRYSEAEPILKRQEQVTLEKPFYRELRHRVSKELMTLYKETGRYKQAFEHADFYYKMKDSLFDIEKREEIIQLNSKNQYEDKVFADSVQQAEQERIDALEADRQAEIQNQKDRTTNTILIAMIFVVGLMIGIVIIIYRSLQNKKKAADLIRRQKLEVEAQRDIAKDRGEKLAEINQEITDSIVYAKRIQSSIMPSEDAVAKMLGEHFVYYRPKAIVAGDFYWIHEVGDRVYFSAADCTGHGVPGALVSVVCSNALTRAVDEYALRDPGKILDKATELVVDNFSKSDELVKDGMDLSLCCWIKSENRLEYAGANNPIYIIRPIEDNQVEEGSVKTDTHYIEEVKANKQPVGYSEMRVPFETKTINLNKGDVVYSFTDGYPDQFGGEKGKKFKYKSMKKLLLENVQDSLSNQEKALEQKLLSWMGDLEQVDDICIIGLRV